MGGLCDCSCNELGSVRDDCEQTTGRCVCKDGVLGMKCDHCAENEVLTADGCIFASGKRKSCKEITCNFGATCKEDDTRSASCICNFDCEDANLIPVCGSDNNTYGSECQMKLFSCRYQREIIIKNEGSCQMQFLVTPLPSPPLMYSTAPESASSSPLHNLFNLSSTSTPSSLSKSGSDAGHPNTQNFSGTTFIKPPYLKMARLNAFIRLSLEIEFQAFAENGIILFNGQTASGAGDFISLALRGGHVEFKYNLGSGQVVLRSHRKIDLQTRVRVAVRRYLRDGKLSVSGQQDVIGKSHGTMKNLDLGDYLYLANVPTDQKKIYELIGVKTGLFGCLFKFKIGSKTIDLKNFYFKFSKLKKKLIEDNQTAAANKTVIAPSPSITSSSYSSSHHLQRDAEFQSLTGPKTATLQIFSGFSYFKLQKIEAKHGLSLEVEFQPFSENGIILYNGQSFSGKGDFVSLAMRDSYVEFRFNLGSGLAILRSRQRLVLGSSVRVTAKRHLRDGKLSVAGQKDVLGKSPGSMKSLDLGDHLYLGGVPESEKRVYENIGLKNGFIGYMSKLKIGGKVVDLKRASLRHVKSKRALYTRRSMSSLFASRKDVLANG
ncbi:agrin-like protein [Dinothrombium tinctorium]|uniref:Agrin-like protein n=1 Tax=Dinothrombium tinctorium TaxID=1965070 RepID=A0A443RK32_9ACAR|nr:agrin-like protein [Dinothrombium tinctorium]